MYPARTSSGIRTPRSAGAAVTTPPEITLTDPFSTGTYSYVEPAFHPIDNWLYGNEGMAHNYFFTFTIQATFVYEACTDQFLSFEGEDDFWVYVDGQLAVDRGGIRPGVEQFVHLDRLSNLVDGNTYEIVMFYAQRQTASSRFILKTNIDMLSSTQVMTSSPAD